MLNQDLKHRICELSYKYGLSHIGSCVTSVDIINTIYYCKGDDEPFILSSGHAGLALYCVLEKHNGIDAEQLYKKHGVHPNRDIENGIYASSGSLGHGIGIAVGMALADRKKNVYVLLSDGECMEGSVWESVRIAHDNNLDNLKIYINVNGYSAYGETNDREIMERFNIYDVNAEIKNTNTLDFPFLKELDAHYYKMTEQDMKYVDMLCEQN